MSLSTGALREVTDIRHYVEPCIGLIVRAASKADTVEYATLECVDWFNHRRLLAPIGDIPPAELEATYYQRVLPLPGAGTHTTESP